MWMAPPEFPAKFSSKELLSIFISLLYWILKTPPLPWQKLFLNKLKSIVIPVIYSSKIVPKCKLAELLVNILLEIVEFCNFIFSNYRTLESPPKFWENVLLLIFIWALLFLF